MAKPNCAGLLGSEVFASVLALLAWFFCITHWLLGAGGIVLLHSAQCVVQHEPGRADAAVGQGFHPESAT